MKPYEVYYILISEFIDCFSQKLKIYYSLPTIILKIMHFLEVETEVLCAKTTLFLSPKTNKNHHLE